MKDLNSILESILKKDVDQAEVYFSSSKAVQIDALNQKVEAVKEVHDQGLGIRIIKNKKLGFAFTSDLDPFVIEKTIEQAIANAKNSEPDEFNSLPLPQTASLPEKLNLYDKQIDETSISKKTKLALKMEETAYKTDKRVKKTEKVTYSDSAAEVRIVNSNGIDSTCKSNRCGAVAQIIATQDGEMEYGFGLDYVKKLKDLDPVKIGKEAAHRACQLLGAKTIKSQKIPIVLDPEIAAELLEVLASPLTAEAVQKGKSLFFGKTGKAVAADGLTIIDNGKLENAIGTAPFDDEGVSTQETKLIEKGILRNYLFNTYTANKGGTKSTGNAQRGSFMGTPDTGPTNLYISKGIRSPKSIINSVKKGLHVTRVMGIHTANPISGDFSFGAAGIMIENGEKTHAVRGITIAGNLIEILMQIEEVGLDLRFFGSVGAPSLLISNISISGA